MNRLVREPKVIPLIAILLAGLFVILVGCPFLRSHRLPRRILLLVQVHQDLALDNESDEAEAADGHQDRVTTLVVRGVVGAIDLGADERADLHNDVVRGRGDGSLLDVECVFRDP